MIEYNFRAEESIDVTKLKREQNEKERVENLLPEEGVLYLQPGRV